jgi:hypothetical protein
MPQAVTTEFTSIPTSFAYKSYYVAVQFLLLPFYFHTHKKNFKIKSAKRVRQVTRYSTVWMSNYDWRQFHDMQLVTWHCKIHKPKHLPRCWSVSWSWEDEGRWLAGMWGDETTGIVTVTLSEGGPIPARVSAFTVTKYRVLGSKSVTCKQISHC